MFEPARYDAHVTVELQSRFERCEPPFDGQTLRAEGLTLAALRQAISSLVESLRGHEALSWFKDWWFHDECLSPSLPFGWEEFDRLVASDEAAEGFMVGDDLCAFAIFPSDFAWLLRVEVQEPSDDPHREACAFDLTGPLFLVQASTDRLAPLEGSINAASWYFLPNG